MNDHKQYIPDWMWTELFPMLTFSDKDHKDPAFVYKKEGWDTLPITNLYKIRDTINFFESYDKSIFLEPKYIKLLEKQPLKWISIIYRKKNTKHILKLFFLEKIYNNFLVENIDTSTRSLIPVKDILIIRDSFTGQRIILQD